MRQQPGKYQPSARVSLLEGRQWPDTMITTEPNWVSVDLRDGNQSKATPMTVEEKSRFFELLVGIGFKEIEVGFPSASKTDYQFVRKLIEEDLIPDDVTIQVLVPTRKDLIEQTLFSLRGAKRAIIHLYVSTAPIQRRVVLKKSKGEILALVRQGVDWIKEGLDQLPETEVRFQFSPESFSATEPEFALAVSQKVIKTWQPTSAKPMILNLPETVQVDPPHLFADKVEYISRNIGHRSAVEISVHHHNDRGTAEASAELALQAGAQRVEGVLFGEGERAGNMSVVVLALNLYTQGVKVSLDLSELDRVRGIYEEILGVTVPARYPYSGREVDVTYSGTHQDAMSKVLRERTSEDPWQVPYIPIDPKDIGRQGSLIAFNGQSGKGGADYLLEQEQGLLLPAGLKREFGRWASEQADKENRGLTSVDLFGLLLEIYGDRGNGLKLHSARSSSKEGICHVVVELEQQDSRVLTTEGWGNGPIDALVSSLQTADLGELSVVDFQQHALSAGADAQAIAYVALRLVGSGLEPAWGVGLDTDIEQASFKAVINALNRLI